MNNLLEKHFSFDIDKGLFNVLETIIVSSSEINNPHEN